eukprot:TRINITY_DN137_c0_g1_i2.p1 TRINITY_DN137_c0_g1~~TRINITY_DN137_c0_g1_i2.p1  ORF type:complete len:708 (-),score=200.72 TRINITY_DN137_c0_g1_i2:202-2325(-)
MRALSPNEATLMKGLLNMHSSFEEFCRVNGWVSGNILVSEDWTFMDVQGPEADVILNHLVNVLFRDIVLCKFSYKGMVGVHPEYDAYRVQSVLFRIAHHYGILCDVDETNQQFIFVGNSTNVPLLAELMDIEMHVQRLSKQEITRIADGINSNDTLFTSFFDVMNIGGEITFLENGAKMLIVSIPSGVNACLDRMYDIRLLNPRASKIYAVHGSAATSIKVAMNMLHYIPAGAEEDFPLYSVNSVVRLMAHKFQIHVDNLNDHELVATGRIDQIRSVAEFASLFTIFETFDPQAYGRVADYIRRMRGPLAICRDNGLFCKLQMVDRKYSLVICGPGNTCNTLAKMIEMGSGVTFTAEIPTVINIDGFDGEKMAEPAMPKELQLELTGNEQIVQVDPESLTHESFREDYPVNRAHDLLRRFGDRKNIPHKIERDQHLFYFNQTPEHTKAKEELSSLSFETRDFTDEETVTFRHNMKDVKAVRDFLQQQKLIGDIRLIHNWTCVVFISTEEEIVKMKSFIDSILAKPVEPQEMAKLMAAFAKRRQYQQPPQQYQQYQMKFPSPPPQSQNQKRANSGFDASIYGGGQQQQQQPPQQQQPQQQQPQQHQQQQHQQQQHQQSSANNNILSVSNIDNNIPHFPEEPQSQQVSDTIPSEPIAPPISNDIAEMEHGQQQPPQHNDNANVPHSDAETEFNLDDGILESLDQLEGLL